MDRAAVGEIVKTEISVGQQFREQDYLAGVHREMLRHMKDRLHGRHVTVLDSIRVEERGAIELRQHAVNFPQRVAQFG